MAGQSAEVKKRMTHTADYASLISPTIDPCYVFSGLREYDQAAIDTLVSDYSVNKASY